jgi:hypothetical protein
MARYAINRRYYTDAVFMASCWAGCFINSTNFVAPGSEIMVIDGDPDSIGYQRKYGHRQAIRADGTPYWHMWNSGDDPTEQANCDAMLKSLSDGGVGVIEFFWFPTAALWAASPPPGGLVISDAFHVIERYLASPYKPRIKWHLLIEQLAMATDADQPVPGRLRGGNFANFTTFVASLGPLMSDDQHFKVGGKPVITLYDDNSGLNGVWDVTHKNAIVTECQDTLGVDPYLVQGNWQSPQVTALGTNAVSAYAGIIQSPTAAPNTYAWVLAGDRVYRQMTGVTVYSFKTIAQSIDSRPWHGDVGNWTDIPIRTEWEQNLRTAMQQAALDGGPHVVYLYSTGEVGEAGAFLPTAQLVARSEATVNPLGIYLDVLRDIRSNVYRRQYWDQYHGWSFNVDVVRVGAWSLIKDQVGIADPTTGSFQYSSARSSTNGNTWKLAPARATTRFMIFGTMGPTYGSVEFSLDGGAYGAPVSLVSVSDIYNQLLYDSGPLSPGLHNVTLRVTGKVDVSEGRSYVSR